MNRYLRDAFGPNAPQFESYDQQPPISAEGQWPDYRLVEDELTQAVVGDDL